MADQDDVSCHDLSSVRAFVPQDREGDRAYVSVVDFKAFNTEVHTGGGM